MSDSVNGHLSAVIKKMARDALRTIVVAYKDLQPNDCGPMHDEPTKEFDCVKDIEKDDFTLISILGIMDIVREEVPGAVEQVHEAGVTVRMVTGDLFETAQAIAVKCNIISEKELDDENVVVVGPAFYKEMDGLTCKNCDKKTPE